MYYTAATQYVSRSLFKHVKLFHWKKESDKKMVYKIFKPAHLQRKKFVILRDHILNYEQ